MNDSTRTDALRSTRLAAELSPEEVRILANSSRCAT